MKSEVSLNGWTGYLISKSLTRMGGAGSLRLVQPLEKNLDQTIIVPSKSLKIEAFDRKWQNFWSDQGLSGQTAPAGPDQTKPV